MKILITGASGFIGSALVPELAQRHEVVALGRGRPKLEVPVVRGDFQQYEDLLRLDEHRFDGAVHLGAVTGGAPEHTAIMVNAVGTRTLLHYLRHRGCRKIVTASSIAAVGFPDQGVPAAGAADSRRASRAWTATATASPST